MWLMGSAIARAVGPEKHRSSAQVEKPPEHTVCPSGGHMLRLKQLFPVRFSRSEADKVEADRCCYVRVIALAKRIIALVAVRNRRETRRKRATVACSIVRVAARRSTMSSSKVGWRGM